MKMLNDYIKKIIYAPDYDFKKFQILNLFVINKLF